MVILIRVSNNSQIQSDEWFEYFKKLNSIPNKFKQQVDILTKALSQKEVLKTFNNLDFRITEDEILKAIKTLKNGKAAGLDGLMNEIIKASKTSLIEILNRIFNAIFAKSQYPKCWTRAYIRPIFKSKSPLDPSNYRGITVMNCFAKLFNKILNSRLDNYLCQNNIIAKEQIGFQKDSRTTDHMFILRTLIEKITQTANNKLYSCFIDFRKAFDTVIHPALFLKLTEIGICGTFYNMLKAMYHEANICVKIENKLTPQFDSNIGVRQGDTISPNLFKIFINDLTKIFDEKCDPVSLHDTNLSCLLFADDVVILSKTESGLQRSLNLIETYCKKWCLELNVDKTKVLIFNKSGKLIKRDFVFGNNTIECVQTYKYLGILFSASGTFSYAKKDLYQRALKGLFKLYRSFSDITPNVSTGLHIFDHTLKSVALYGCEIWGSSTLSKTKEFKIEKSYEQYDCEKLNIKFCKYLLGVHKKASNYAVLGELGRYPIYITIICSIFKYLVRLQDMDNDSLLFKAYTVSKNLSDNGKKSWINNVEQMLQELNIKNSNIDISNVKNILIKRFRLFWNNKVNQNGKLDTYVKFKNNIGMEPYHLQIKNGNHRKALTRLRISAHTLEIEQGRYKNKPREERLCSSCKKIENEDHFILNCSLYLNERTILLDIVNKLVPNFKNLIEDQKFLYLMTCEDTIIMKELGKYVFNSFKTRDERLPPTVLPSNQV